MASPFSAAPKQSASRYRIVQFEGPLSDQLHRELTAKGWDFVAPIPPTSYIVRSPAGPAPKGVRWAGAIAPEWKLDPLLTQSPKGLEEFVDTIVILWPGEDSIAAEAELLARGAIAAKRSTNAACTIMGARVPVARLQDVAAIESVQWIERAPMLSLRNNTVTGVVQSGQATSRPLWDRGLRGQGQMLGHIDGPLDFSTCYLSDPESDAFGPAHRKIQGFRGIGAVSNHGTHTAATAVGRNVSGSDSNAGVAPDARLTHGVYTSLIPHYMDDVARNFVDFSAMLEAARDDGAAIHSNSWGDDARSDYIWLATAADTFSWENENALVVVAATNGPTLAAPENAKNVLAVGATRRWDDIGSFFSGGTGPTLDGRRKPEIYAPGQGTVSAISGSCNVGALSGTSMACPAVAGAGLLARQYFMEGWYPTGSRVAPNGFTPSGALLKALLLNATVDMPGLDGFPGDREGWGRLVLHDSLFFAGDTHSLWLLDARRSGGGALISGGVFEHAFTVTAPIRELRVTLSWMDPPAAHLASVVAVNDLNLEVQTPSEVIFPGNAFADGISVEGGFPDALNNVEQVLLRDLGPGVYTLRVAARQVDPVNGPQGFAIVARAEFAVTGWIAR